MKSIYLNMLSFTFLFFFGSSLLAQKKETVEFVKGNHRIDILIGKKPFTSFLYPDTLEKPILYPVYASNGTIVTRGFPLIPLPNDPTDHPHQMGIWFNHENLNGLDFWNNSYAIPAEKKHLYGWIKTDAILQVKGGEKGVLIFHANWTNQQNQILAEEKTTLEFSGTDHQRIIDRVTTLTADTDLLFKDAKDGLLGFRLAHALQIPTDQDQKFTDDKGNVTIVKAGTDKLPNGTYLTSEGKTGDSAWSTRARWCKVYGKMDNDSITIAIIDHPSNVNYPTFWHARGYGLFAANPLGANIFTNGKSSTNLKVKKGESVTFRFRIVINEGTQTLTVRQLNELSDQFAKEN
jgi:hypothetical protein